VVSEIAKYFTDARDGSYDNKSDEYTFTLNEEDMNTAKDSGYNKRQLKAWILNYIQNAGESHASRDRQASEKRKEERAIKKEREDRRAIEKSKERKAKLLSLKV